MIIIDVACVLRLYSLKMDFGMRILKENIIKMLSTKVGFVVSQFVCRCTMGEQEQQLLGLKLR